MILRGCRILILLLICASPTSIAMSSTSQIDWRIEAGFSPFAYTSRPDEVMTSWATIVDGNYASWAAALDKAPGLESPFAEFTTDDDARGPWLSSSAQYDRKYVHPTHTTLRASLLGATGACEWTISGNPTLPAVPCNDYTRIKDVPLKGATLSVKRTDTGESFSEAIIVDHRVILAMGDSYASGEGNPDVATTWQDRNVRSRGVSWLRTFIKGDARWWDATCHRSFWSSQTLVALKIAASDPHRLVTYLHYSCSGAEVLDGMLVRQAKPPGIKKPCFGKACNVITSQLAAAVRDLCVGNAVHVDEADALAKGIKNVVIAKGQALWRAEQYNQGKGLDLVRCQGELVIPDLVLLSIGGNDAGFAQLAAWAIIPAKWRLAMVGKLAKGKLVCPHKGRNDNDGCKEPFDFQLTRQLQQRYTLLADALREVLPVASSHVVQSIYPDPMLRAGGNACGESKGGYNPKSPWLGAALLAPRGAMRETRWHFNITESEARVLSTSSLTEMMNAMDRAIHANGFVKADLYRAFTDHGWCSPPIDEPPLALPSFDPGSTFWHCKAKSKPFPSCWSAYAPSQRFIRTMNDSLLTQSSSRRDGHTGAVHPNLGGHATMADIIFDSAAGALSWVHE